MAVFIRALPLGVLAAFSRTYNSASEASRSAAPRSAELAARGRGHQPVREIMCTMNL